MLGDPHYDGSSDDNLIPLVHARDQAQSKSHLMGSSIIYSGRCFSTFDHHQEISTIPAESHPETLGHYRETQLIFLGYNLVLLNEYHIFQLCIFIKYYLYT